MKIKALFLSLIVLGASSSAFAQTFGAKGDEKLSKFKDNIFISVGIGAQGYINVDNLDYGFGKSFNPLFNLSVGKMITPQIGVRGQFSGYQSTLYTDFNRLNNGGKYDKYTKNYISFYGDILLNVSNLWREYNVENRFDLLVFAGPGLSMGKFSSDKYGALINGSVGVGGKYNINKFWSIDLEARGSMFPTFYQISRTNQDGILGITAGVTYTFGGRKFIKPVHPNALSYAQNENKSLANKNQAQQDEITALKNRKPEVIVKEKVVYKTNDAVPLTAINFDFNKWNIRQIQEINIYNWAKYLKANPEVKIVVTGYADKVGTDRANMTVSERRANAVATMLVKKYGIAKDRITIGYKGANSPYDNNPWRRCVIIDIAK